MLDNKTYIHWKTASEANNSHFVVQRGLDIENWEDIATITASGTTNVLKNYSFLDENLPVGQNKLYYRLGQVDLDGRQTYSQIVEVSLNTTYNQSFKVFPNPAKESVNVKYIAVQSGDIQLVLTDIIGNILSTQTHSTTQGINIINLNTNHLASGIYQISAQQPNGIKYHHKLVIAK